jgi:hypothetical protein
MINKFIQSIIEVDQPEYAFIVDVPDYPQYILIF